MSEFKCCLCNMIADDDKEEVCHYGAKSAHKTCVDEVKSDVNAL